VATALLSSCIGDFGNSDATCGSPGAAACMMTWMGISMIVVLVDAEFDAQIERQTTIHPGRAESDVAPSAPRSASTRSRLTPPSG
jgi:uncharacterized BrkB/YihY/UPF0761 family membrane protein